MIDTDTDVDVAVIGGGPSGAVAAMVLARGGTSTLLIDRPAAMHALAEGLPAGAKPLMKSLGLWDTLATDGQLVSHGNRSAWGSAGIHENSSVADPNGHGWRLDRRRFDTRLRAAARAAGAGFRAAGVRAAVRAAGHWTFTVDADPVKSYRARWLIDCTGRRGTIARRHGGRRSAVDRLVAVVASQRDHDSTADVDTTMLVESAADGWWYTSSMPSRERVVAYLTDADDPSARIARSPHGFASMLGRTRHVSAYFRDAAVGPIAVVGAGTSRLERPAGDGWLAAGDAAMSFDPLSSQGIFNALHSGMAAARAIASRLAGDPDAIERYCNQLATVYDTYLIRRAQYYDQERRWVDRPFWRRRTPR